MIHYVLLELLGNAYTSALNAGLRYMPDFGATVRDGLKNDFEERMQAYDLNFQLDKTKKDSAAALDEYNRNKETNSYVEDQRQQSQRFAGVLSGLGTVASAYALKKEYDRANDLELKRIKARAERDKMYTDLLTNSSKPTSNEVGGFMKMILERQGLYKPGMTLEDLDSPDFQSSFLDSYKTKTTDNQSSSYFHSYSFDPKPLQGGYRPLS